MIVVDGLAGQLSFENARILFLAANEGYHDLAHKLQRVCLLVDLKVAEFPKLALIHGILLSLLI